MRLVALSVQFISEKLGRSESDGFRPSVEEDTADRETTFGIFKTGHRERKLQEVTKMKSK